MSPDIEAARRAVKRIELERDTLAASPPRASVEDRAIVLARLDALAADAWGSVAVAEARVVSTLSATTEGERT